MATLTLLQVVQEMARRHGISVPSAVVTSQDETILQLWGMANETMEELNERCKWVELITRLTFNHAGDSDYGALLVKGPSATVTDWLNMIPRTLWDGTANLELIGPVDEVTWQATVNLQISAGRYQFRFYGNKLYIYPLPNPLNSVDFKLEYYSTCPIVANDGTTLKFLFSADDDVSRVPTRLLTLGIRWRYKKEKGLPYAEDKDTYEIALQNQQSSSGQQQKLHMDQDTFAEAVGPMIMIPPGSWPVT